MTDDERRAYVREWTKARRARETADERTARLDRNREAQRARTARLADQGTSRYRQLMESDPDYPAVRKVYRDRAHAKMRDTVGFADSNRKQKYGLSRADFDRMRVEQGHACAMCGLHEDANTRATLFVDHDHATGRVRGLLCARCNTGLGYLETVGFVENAGRYLGS